MYRLAILCSESPGRVDAIREYSLRLADALRRSGRVIVDLHLRSPSGEWKGAVAAHEAQSTRSRSGLVDCLAGYDAVVLQYNPFMYGLWGFAPWLPASLWSLRRSRRSKIALMVHEPYVPMIGWRWVLMGAWQRAQLYAIRAQSDVVLGSIEAWTEDLRALRPRRPTYHLPVGSNVPDRREVRDVQRERLQVGKKIVLASISSGHPSRFLDYIVAAANTVAEEQGGAVLLNLGAGAPALDGLAAAVEVHAPGRLSAEDLAAHVAAADIFLAPFIDGVSTRRGSMMAALQHGVAIVGTDGLLTDSLLRGASAAIQLVPVERRDLFAQAAAGLAAADDRRCQLGRAGRRLYEEWFAWAVVATRLTDVLLEYDSR